MWKLVNSILYSEKFDLLHIFARSRSKISDLPENRTLMWVITTFNPYIDSFFCKFWKTWWLEAQYARLNPCKMTIFNDVHLQNDIKPQAETYYERFKDPHKLLFLSPDRFFGPLETICYFYTYETTNCHNSGSSRPKISIRDQIQGLDASYPMVPMGSCFWPY